MNEASELMVGIRTFNFSSPIIRFTQRKLLLTKIVKLGVSQVFINSGYDPIISSHVETLCGFVYSNFLCILQDGLFCNGKVKG